ncbi:MAG: radical SAM protein [Candidatus Woesearchaeota archaeon]|nr:MAG: radical SAM protein [Candidatus Woesearchaeota archaeon]
MVKIERLAPRKIEVDESKPISLKHYSLKSIERDYNESKLPYMVLWLDEGCNLNCGYCATNSKNVDSQNYFPNKNNLSPVQITELINQFADLGGKVININGQGEPFLNPKLLDYIKLSKDYDIDTIITTNGTLIGKENAKKSYDNDVSFNVKLHALYKDFHNITVGKDAFDNTYNGLKNLMSYYYDKISEEKDEVISPISIMTLVFKDALPYVPDVLRFNRENIFYPSLDDLVCEGRAKTKSWTEQIISNEEMSKLIKGFEEIMGYDYPQPAKTLCPASVGIFMGSEGKLLIDRNNFCCDGLAEETNLKFPEKSLHEIWENLLEARKNTKIQFDPEAVERMLKRKICYGMAKTQLDALKEFKPTS